MSLSTEASICPFDGIRGDFALTGPDELSHSVGVALLDDLIIDCTRSAYELSAIFC